MTAYYALEFMKKNVKSLACLLFVLMNISVFAQDIIYPKQGDSILAKVLQIQHQEVTYKRYDNLNGPDYVMSIQLIDKIVYQNKTVDDFSNKTKAHLVTQYGNNKIGLHPVSLYGTEDELYLGAGLSYERLFLHQLLGIQVGGFLAFDQRMAGFDYQLKIYPLRKGNVQYYTGIAGQSGLFYQLNMSKGDSNPFNSFVLINGISAQLTKNFYLGLHTGIGMCYQNVLIPDLYVVKHDWVAGMTYQGALHIGFRF